MSCTWPRRARFDGDGLDVDVDALLGEAGVVGLDYALGVGAADGGGVGVGGVEQELDGGGPLAREVAGVVVGDDDSGVGVAAADGVAELVDGGIVAGEFEALAFGECGDEFAAFGRAAVVDDSEADIGDGGAEGESEEGELQDGREDERDLEPAVAADLVELLLDESAHAVAEEAAEKIGNSLHAFTCIFLMPRQASV